MSHTVLPDISPTLRSSQPLGMAVVGGRNPAYDFIRGFALISILLAHIPLNALTVFTIRDYALFDATEVFVFIAGFMVGLVWLKMAARQGTMAPVRRFVIRAIKLYVYFVFAAIGLSALCLFFNEIGWPYTVIWNGFGDLMRDETVSYLIEVVTLYRQPNLIDVLVMYVILVGLVPVMMPAIINAPILTMTACFVVWYFGPELNAMLPVNREEGFVFNPFAWQLVFFSGMTVVTHGRSLTAAMDALPWPGRHVTRGALWVLSLALILVGIWYGMQRDIHVIRELELHGQFRDWYRDVYGPLVKWNVDFLRYCGLLAWVWMMSHIINRDWSRFLRTWFARLVMMVGQNGLTCFVGGLFISLIYDAIGRQLGAAFAVYLTPEPWFGYNYFDGTVGRGRDMTGLFAIVDLAAIGTLFLLAAIQDSRGRVALKSALAAILRRARGQTRSDDDDTQAALASQA